MHASRKKSSSIDKLWVPGLLLLASLGACVKAPEMPAEAQSPEVETAPKCGSDGYLSSELYGSISKKIDWSAAELHCESMLRPDSKGVRLRFTGKAAESRLSIILAMPELQRGAISAESPTVVTLTVEGSGRFFSTPTLASCWTDINQQDLVENGGDVYIISGTLYCVAPLGEVNGDAAISIPEMAFRGIVDWSAK